jgi:hypothetical protein
MHFTVLIITASFVVVYMLAAFFNFISAIAVSINPDLLPPSRLAYQDRLVQYVSKLSRAQKAAGLIGVFSSTLAWPGLIPKYDQFKSRTSNLQYGARSQLEPRDGRVAATMLIVLLIIGLLERLGVVWSNLAGVTLAIFLIAILLRHISYVFGSLPERLRRSQYDPLRSFLLVAFCDAIAITLCVTLLRSWRQPSETNWGEIRITALELFNTPHQVTDIAGLTILQIAIAMVGLLYYIAVVKSGSGLKQFKRTDKDIRDLANLSVSAGNVTQARAWMKKEQSRNLESYVVDARIALAEGNFDEAVGSIRRNLRAKGEDDSPDSINIALISLASFTPMAPSLVTSFLRYLIDNSSDVIASLALDNPIFLGNEREKLAKDLLDLCPEATFPLTRSVLMALLNDAGEAIAILGRATPGSEIEELMRLVWQCMLVLIDPKTTVDETSRYIDRWFDESFPIVREAARGIEGMYRLGALSRLVLLQLNLDLFTERYGLKDDDSKNELRGRLLLELAGQLAESDDILNRLRAFHLKNLASQEAFQPASA